MGDTMSHVSRSIEHSVYYTVTSEDDPWNGRNIYQV
eukprot:COSAG05_NODE_11412_length_514_cov_4.920482_1_plen_35_part_01